jgi:hypothetical protein
MLKESQCRKHIVDDEIVSQKRAIAEATLIRCVWQLRRLITCPDQFRQEHRPPNADCDPCIDQRKSRRLRPKHADLATSRHFILREAVEDEFVIQAKWESWDNQVGKWCNCLERNPFRAKKLGEIPPFTVESLISECEGPFVGEHRVDCGPQDVICLKA